MIARFSRTIRTVAVSSLLSLADSASWSSAIAMSDCTFHRALWYCRGGTAGLGASNVVLVGCLPECSIIHAPPRRDRLVRRRFSLTVGGRGGHVVAVPA